jgi:hypothetical protein
VQQLLDVHSVSAFMVTVDLVDLQQMLEVRMASM